MNKSVKIQSIETTESTELEKARNVAKEMLNFIKETKLYTKIKNKGYIMVDGWQFLSIRMNIIPIITETVNLSKEKEYKYKAVCDLTQDDKVIGRGIGICSTNESSKRNFDEYAILSMAQTRAIGKAYRNRFGWLAKLAGYEATPYEEMPQNRKRE